MREQGAFATNVPARLDRLRWSRFHTLVVVALGVTWILDGLEVTRETREPCRAHRLRIRLERVGGAAEGIQVARPAVEARRPLTAIFRTPYRRRVLEVGAIWFLAYVCTQNGVAVWKD